jgi:DNA-binding CsgD family transcriptional regulator
VGWLGAGYGPAEGNGLIEALYDAALGHQAWEQAGHQIREYMGSKTLMLSTHDPLHKKADVVLTLGMTGQQVQEYGHFAQHDVWALGALERRIFGKALVGEQVVDDDAFLRSYIYNEYLKPSVDARYMVGSLVRLQGGNHAAIGVHRPHDGKDFTLEDAERLNRLLPHVQRALEVRQRIQCVDHKSNATNFVLDQLSLGVFLISATGRLLHVNAAGEEILKSGDGLQRAPDGLRACNRDDDRRLQHLIGDLRQASPEARSAGGHLRVHRPSGRPAYALMLTPVRPGLAGADASPAVLVFVSDPAAKIAADCSVLAGLFGFPPAEARLVLALMSGTPLPEIALQTGVTYNTIRTQLARAPARTETRSQVELVLLVARALGGVAPGAIGG